MHKKRVYTTRDLVPSERRQPLGLRLRLHLRLIIRRRPVSQIHLPGYYGWLRRLLRLALVLCKILRIDGKPQAFLTSIVIVGGSYLLRQASSGLRSLPDLVVIGVAKGGTTSVADHISQHPDIAPPFQKETHFFSRNFARGLSSYKANFPCSLLARKKLTFEATPTYYLYRKSAIRLRECVGNGVKVVLILRDPAERAWSHYQNSVRRGTESISRFEDALDAEQERVMGAYESALAGEIEYSTVLQEHGYFSGGCYATFLKVWLEYFSWQDLLVMDFDELKESPEQFMARIYTFCGLEPVRLNEYPVYSSAVGRSLDKEVRDKLILRYADQDSQLAEILGRMPSWAKSR